MNVLVTGSAGFIGSNLADSLIRRGDEVIGIDRRQRLGATHRQIVADLTDPRSAPKLALHARRAEVIFHLAARAGTRAEQPQIEVLRHRDIVMATRSVLAATPPEVHLIVASSSSVYGGARRSDGALRPSHESDSLHPRGGYAVCKTEMERLCAGRAAAGGRVAVVRPFTVIGEHQRHDMAVSLWLDAALDDQPVSIIGSLERTRDVTDVRRVVDGLRVIADSGFEGLVNLGAGRPRSLGEILKAVFSAVGREVPVLTRPAPSQEVEDTFADVVLARRLGIDLTTDLEECVRRQVWARTGDPAMVGT